MLKFNILTKKSLVQIMKTYLKRPKVKRDRKEIKENRVN